MFVSVLHLTRNLKCCFLNLMAVEALDGFSSGPSVFLVLLMLLLLYVLDHTGSPVHVSHAKALLRALFVAADPIEDSEAEMKKELHETSHEWSSPSQSVSPKRPAGDGIGAAPLLNLLNSKVGFVPLLLLPVIFRYVSRF